MVKGYKDIFVSYVKMKKKSFGLLVMYNLPVLLNCAT